jgi:ferredoxin--NADP+ reductase
MSAVQAAITETEDAQWEVPASAYALTVTSIHHYTDRLFQFSVERPQEFRFRSGEFVMIGLPGQKPVWRAYSIASPSWEEKIDFFSIKVPDGPLTSELQKIKPGDKIWMRKKPVGTLVHDALIPGSRLYLLSTGTGIAPFASIIRDPETYEKFDQVVLMHTTRQVAEGDYGRDLVREIQNHEFLNEIVGDKLIHYHTVTQEEGTVRGRVTDLLKSGKALTDLGLPALDPSTDRIMICGSMAMLEECKEMAETMGFDEGSNSQPGQFVIEKAFVG